MRWENSSSKFRSRLKTGEKPSVGREEETTGTDRKVKVWLKARTDLPYGANAVGGLRLILEVIGPWGNSTEGRELAWHTGTILASYLVPWTLPEVIPD